MGEEGDANTQDTKIEGDIPSRLTVAMWDYSGRDGSNCLPERHTTLTPACWRR